MKTDNIYKEIAIIISCSFFASIIQMVPPFLATEIFDVIIPHDLRVTLIEIILLLIAFAAANIGFSVLINLAVVRIKIKKFDSIKNKTTLESLRDVVSNLFAFIYIIALYKFNVSITNYVLIIFLILFAAYFAANKRKYKLLITRSELEIIKINNALNAFHIFFDFASTGIVFLLIARSDHIEAGVFIAYTATFFILRTSLGKLLKASNILPELIHSYKSSVIQHV
jgi:ABC-type bacteriocin/lantibiotic exporter with double-glycine peptidase domain